MSNKLYLHISAIAQPETREVDSLNKEHWTSDAEVVLLKRIQEILSLVRKGEILLNKTVEIDVQDPDLALSLVENKLSQVFQPATRKSSLSLREIEVLGLIISGHTNHQIADHLFISYETVKSHRKNILAKTGAINTAALVNFYHQNLL